MEVSLHGSSQSGFALLSSDVNVNVSIPESVADLSQVCYVGLIAIKLRDV